MNRRLGKVQIFVCAIALAAACCAALGGQASDLAIPAGTKLSTLKYSDGSLVNLKPAEQVAFLVVYTIKDLENTCGSTFFGGPGRPCLMSELINGITTKNGQAIGLTVNPIQGNYLLDTHDILS